MSKVKKRLSKFLNFNKTLANAVLQHFAACGEMMVSNFLNTPYKGASPAELFGLTRRLERNGFIKKIQKNNREFFILTEEGRNMANLLKFKDISSQKWDGKWRVIIFDVPEKYKKRRNFLRNKLKQLGFVQLQESVWVFPHQIPKAFDWLLEEIGLKFSVRYLIVDSINYEKDLLRKFNLSR